MEKFRLKIPLAGKILLTVILISGLVGIGTIAYFTYDLGKLLQRTEEDRLHSLLSEQTHEVSLILDSSANVVAKVATLPEVVSYLENPKRDSQDKKILESFSKFPLSEDVQNLYLLDLNGVAVLSLDKSLLGGDYSFRDYFKSAMGGKPTTTWAIGVTTKVPGFYFSYPVVNKSGQIVGVAVLKVDTKSVSTSLIDSHLSESGYLMLVDNNGVVLSSNKPDTVFKSLGNMSEEVKRNYLVDLTYSEEDIKSLQYDRLQELVTQGAEESVFSIYDEEDGTNELLGLAKVGKYPFYLVEEEDLDKITTKISQLTSNLVVIFLATVVLVIVLEIILIRGFIRPLNTLNDYAKRVTQGGVDGELLVEKTGDEIETLSESISKMVLSLRGLSFGLEQKVKEKTSQLEKSLENVEQQNKRLEEARKAILNVLEDLDEEKNKINNEKNRVETIISSIADGVFVTDREGRVMMMNKAAEKMSGYDFRFSVGKPYTEIFRVLLEDKMDEVYPDFVKETIDSGSPNVVKPKSVLLSRDGKMTPIYVLAAALKDTRGEVFGCVVVAHDNTEERNLDRAKDEFLSVASHQLRTPLGGMRWNLEMVKNGDFGEVNPEVNEVIETIYQGSLKMIDLVNDLLNVSRIDQGRVMDEPIETDLAEVVKQAVTSLTPLAQRDGVIIKMSITDNVPKVVIDPKRFNEVVVNLVSNSVKYHSVNGEVRVDLGFDGEVIKMVVADNGIGIPEKDLHRVFEKFFRAGNAAKSETEGSGLGLYICKRFVEGWGGKITVESEEGKGTTFTVLLPKDIRNIKIV